MSDGTSRQPKTRAQIESDLLSDLLQRQLDLDSKFWTPGRARYIFKLIHWRLAVHSRAGANHYEKHRN